MIKLMGYDYKVEYRKGRENRAADALSRRDVNGQGSDEDCNAIVTIIPDWVEDVKGSYINDPLYEKLVTNNQMSAGEDNSYILEAGLLRYKGRILWERGTTVEPKFWIHSILLQLEDIPEGELHTIESKGYFTGLS